jgi:uncharacterized sulfatase
MGDPHGLDDSSAEAPAYEDLAIHTQLAYADLDASPTKAWMIHHRNEEPYQKMFTIGFGKRPAHELYDVKRDPDHMHNLADLPEYREIRDELADRLDQVLLAEDDPRLTEKPCRYESPPYAGPVE